VRAIARQVEDALEAADASSDTGEQARQKGIASFKALEKAMTEAIASAKASTGAVKAYKQHKQAKGDRLRKSAQKHAKKSGKLSAKSARLRNETSALLGQLPQT
jgi:hypothetical protein